MADSGNGTPRVRVWFGHLILTLWNLGMAHHNHPRLHDCSVVRDWAVVCEGWRSDEVAGELLEWASSAWCALQTAGAFRYTAAIDGSTVFMVSVQYSKGLIYIAAALVSARYSQGPYHQTRICYSQIFGLGGLQCYTVRFSVREFGDSGPEPIVIKSQHLHGSAVQANRKMEKRNKTWSWICMIHVCFSHFIRHHGKWKRHLVPFFSNSAFSKEYVCSAKYDRA